MAAASCITRLLTNRVGSGVAQLSKVLTPLDPGLNLVHRKDEDKVGRVPEWPQTIFKQKYLTKLRQIQPHPHHLQPPLTLGRVNSSCSASVNFFARVEAITLKLSHFIICVPLRLMLFPDPLVLRWNWSYASHQSYTYLVYLDYVMIFWESELLNHGALQIKGITGLPHNFPIQQKDRLFL